MQLNTKTLRHLAELVCGDSGVEPFPYRTGSRLTRFFKDCDLGYVHNGTTRLAWVFDVLEKLNAGVASNQHLPADDLIRVIQELLDTDHFGSGKDRPGALAALNAVLKRDGLAAYFDGEETTQVHRVDVEADSKTLRRRRRDWTPDEIRKLELLGKYLDSASEDEFTFNLLVPLLSLRGYQRLSVAGHTDKALEYGTDLWWKLPLPTDHFIYFGAQVKKGTIDAAGRTKGDRSNVTELLNQARMMVDYPIFDPEVNRKVLVDHVYIISTGTITKQAKQWLVEHLDQLKRRHLIFMDRDEILGLVINSAMPLPECVDPKVQPTFDNDPVPF